MNFLLMAILMASCFGSGYLLAPEKVKTEFKDYECKCETTVYESAYKAAMDNCKRTGEKDFNCMHFINGGRYDRIPVPTPTPSPYPKYKVYKEKDVDEDEQLDD